MRRVIICAIVVLTAACSSTATSGSGTTTGDVSRVPSSAASNAAPASGPCALLSADDAHALDLHYPGRSDTADFGPACDYGTVRLTLIRAAVSETAFAYGATRRVSGLGQRAFYGAEYHWLRVAAGATRFEVMCYICGDNPLDTLTQVAQKVLTHVR